MRVIKTISRILSKLESSIVVFLLGFMITLAFVQVILRNFFSVGFLWADPLLRHIVLWIGFLGASLATQKERHINIDLITRFTSNKITNIIRIFTNLFAFTITSFLAYSGYTFLRNEIDSGELLLTIGQLNIPAWYFQLIIPIGFSLMSFRFLIRSVEHIIEAVGLQNAETVQNPPQVGN